MADRVDLLGLFDTEWKQLLDCPSYRRQLRRWQSQHAALRAVTDLRDLLAQIEGGDLGESSEIVWALLDLVSQGDELAARTVLQAIVPGLAGESAWLVSWARRVEGDPLSGPAAMRLGVG